MRRPTRSPGDVGRLKCNSKTTKTTAKHFQLKQMQLFTLVSAPNLYLPECTSLIDYEAVDLKLIE